MTPLTRGTARAVDSEETICDTSRSGLPQVEAKEATQMLSLRLVRLIERHSEELVFGLTQQVRDSERTSGLQEDPAR